MMGHKSLANFVSHLKRLWPDTGPEPRYDFSSYNLNIIKVWSPKSLKSTLQHTLATSAGQTTPAGMRRSHAAALQVGQQDRQAIGHHDGAGHAGLAGDRRIGHLAVCTARVERRYRITMHLGQKNRSHAQGLGQRCPVGGNRCGRVANMVTQVEAVVGAARAATIAAGAEGLHPGRRGPLWLQPVWVHHLTQSGFIVRTVDRLGLVKGRQGHAGVKSRHGARQSIQIGIKPAAIEDLGH